MRPNAPHFTDGANEASREVTAAYHVHLDEQDPQGEALPQALQPLVDVVWVEVVVAEAGGQGRGRDWEASVSPRSQEPFFTLTGRQRAWATQRSGAQRREVTWPSSLSKAGAQWGSQQGLPGSGSLEEQTPGSSRRQGRDLGFGQRTGNQGSESVDWGTLCSRSWEAGPSQGLSALASKGAGSGKGWLFHPGN